MQARLFFKRPTGVMRSAPLITRVLITLCQNVGTGHTRGKLREPQRHACLHGAGGHAVSLKRHWTALHEWRTGRRRGG